TARTETIHQAAAERSEHQGHRAHPADQQTNGAGRDASHLGEIDKQIWQREPASYRGQQRADEDPAGISASGQHTAKHGAKSYGATTVSRAIFGLGPGPHAKGSAGRV